MNLGQMFGEAFSPDHGKAVAAYEKVLELDPSLYLAHYNLGILYERQRDYDNALHHFNQVIALSVRIASSRRQEVMVYVRYRKCKISYAQFKEEVHMGLKRDKARLSRSEWQNFLEMLPLGAFETERGEATASITRLDAWLELNTG